MADAVWLADLLAHGLIRPSFVPEAPTQEMRALLRTRKQLVREQASHVQRIQKTLEDANLKLSSVLTQIMGKSGRAILQALIDGERDPDTLLTLVQRGVKAPPERLRKAPLQGRVTEQHRFLLRLHLRHVDALGAAIDEIDAEVDRNLAPFRQAVRQLRTIPGVRPHRPGHHLGNRHRHEPLPHRRTPDLLGWSLPAQRRECGQTALDTAAQGRPVAQDYAGAVRLGGQSEESQLSASSV